jgi:hypothetical protein
MSGYEFECLKLDIKENGQREPIIIHDGMILDGGNRYRACVDLGIEPEFMKFGGGESIAAYVLSANLHRRHLTPGQQASIVACVQDWGKAQTSSRPKKGCNVAPLSTSKDRATQSGASVRTQKSADKVAKADPKLAAQVARGEVSLPQAVKRVSKKTKPKKVAEPALPQEDPPEEYPDESPSDDEMQESIAAEAEQLEYIKQLLCSDDPLAQSIKDVVQYKAVARIATERFNGLQNERNELIRMVKSLRRKIDALEKAAK